MSRFLGFYPKNILYVNKGNHHILSLIMRLKVPFNWSIVCYLVYVWFSHVFFQFLLFIANVMNNGDLEIL